MTEPKSNEGSIDTSEGLIEGHTYEAPHCDSLVLHAPGTCIYCDHFPKRQQERVTNNVNFTGEGDPAKSPCPAEVRRPVGTIHRWGGNVPMTATMQRAQAAEWAKFNEEMRKRFGGAN